MKKIILILTFFAFLTNSKAQDIENLRVGLIFSNAFLFNSYDNVKIEGLVSYDYDYGISFDYFLTDNYALSTGLYIDNPIIRRKNGFANNIGVDSAFLASDFAIKNNINSTTIHNKEKIKNMSLNIPLSFKLKTNEIGYFKYFGDIGILNSFRLQSRYSLTDTELQRIRFAKKSNIELPYLNHHTNLYNFSLKVGGGIEYTISDKTALMVGIYFYRGFVNFIEDGDNKASYMNKLSLRTGILF